MKKFRNLSRELYELAYTDKDRESSNVEIRKLPDTSISPAEIEAAKWGFRIPPANYDWLKLKKWWNTTSNSKLSKDLGEDSIGKLDPKVLDKQIADAKEIFKNDTFENSDRGKALKKTLDDLIRKRFEKIEPPPSKKPIFNLENIFQIRLLIGLAAMGYLGFWIVLMTKRGYDEYKLKRAVLKSINTKGNRRKAVRV